MNIKFLNNEKVEDTLARNKNVSPRENSTQLRDYVINYVGEIKAEKNEVDVNMIAEVLAEEFPEFMLAVAEENWFRGYQQALTDVSIGEKLAKQEEEIKSI